VIKKIKSVTEELSVTRQRHVKLLIPVPSLNRTEEMTQWERVKIHDRTIDR
jgi:hypothetical protein